MPRGVLGLKYQYFRKGLAARVAYVDGWMGARGRILIVDDEESVVDVVGGHLKDLGYEIDEARTGEEALRLATAARYDVILLDVLLPGMNGIDVLKRLRTDERTAAVPVAFLTVLGEAAHVLEGFEAGGNAYVVKPLDLHRIAEVVGLLARETRAH